MGRRLVVSDVHGFYDAMVSALKEADYKPKEDTLICIGDMINRGPKSAEVVRFMRTYANVVTIGNHETGLPLWLMQEIPDENWFGMGGDKTANSYITTYGEKAADKLAEDAAWISSLDMMYEDDDFIYAHAGIDPKRHLEVQRPEDVLWGQCKDFYTSNIKGKPVIFGHVPVKHLYRWNKENFTQREVFQKSGKIGIDGGSIAGDYVFVYDADNNKTYSTRVSRGLKDGESNGI